MERRQVRYYTRRNLSHSCLERFFNRLSITNWIILINVVFFVISLGIIILDEGYLDYLALKPSLALQGKYLWTFLTHMFMHAGTLHLFVNMISLFFIGNFVEKLIGRKRFIWVYLGAGLFAALFFVLLSSILGIDLNVYAVGASGAIFGLGGLLAILTPRLPVLVFFILPMPMWLAIIVLLFGLWFASLVAGFPVGNWAHLGGLFVGVIYGLYLRKKYKRKTRMLDRYFR